MTTRWDMIGCGDVAEVKSGPGFYKTRDSSLLAIMRRNGALAADYARRHGVVCLISRTVVAAASESISGFCLIFAPR